MNKVKIFGVSDDLVVIENSSYSEDEIGCYDSDVRISFEDGTVILAGYNKPNLGVWWIEVEQKGSAPQSLTVCNDEDADPYSDIFEIEAEIISHEVVDKGSPKPVGVQVTLTNAEFLRQQFADTDKMAAFLCRQDWQLAEIKECHDWLNAQFDPYGELAVFFQPGRTRDSTW